MLVGQAPKTAFYFGDTISTDQANYAGDRVYGNGKKGVDQSGPTPVGSFPPNAFGLCDMHGSVWQWYQDSCDKDYYQHSPKRIRLMRRPANSNLRAPRRLVAQLSERGSFCRPLPRAPSLAIGTTAFASLRHFRRRGEAKSAQHHSEKDVPPSKEITNSIGMKLVYIPPGKFVMGSPRSEQEQAQKDSGSRGLGRSGRKSSTTWRSPRDFTWAFTPVTQEEYEQGHRKESELVQRTRRRQGRRRWTGHAAISCRNRFLERCRGVLPEAEPTGREDLSPADRGRMGVCLPGGHEDGILFRQHDLDRPGQLQRHRRLRQRP